MNRQELIEIIKEIEFFPEKKEEIFSYLPDYIEKLDLEVVLMLLNAGASPNSKDNLSDYLHLLFHEYQVLKTTKGEIIISIMTALLQSGADANKVWCNNWRAYDYAASSNVNEISDLLLKFGADPKIRPII